MTCDVTCTKQRESNIELLRLVLMMMVVLLHFNYDAMGGAFEKVKNSHLDNYALHFLESLGICAVNCFMIVSGFSCTITIRLNLAKYLTFC